MLVKIAVYDIDDYEIYENNIAVYVTNKKTGEEIAHYGGVILLDDNEIENDLVNWELTDRTKKGVIVIAYHT